MILKDRVVIVTGAGSGIGQAAARIIAAEGAVVGVVVGVVDRNSLATQTTVDLTDDPKRTAAFNGFIAARGQAAKVLTRSLSR